MDPSATRRIGRLLGQAYALWQRRTYGRLAQMGFPEIRPAHSPVFRSIDPRGTRVVDLALRAAMTKQSMAYLVKSLEDLRLVEIAEDPDDRRARLVRLTPRGTQAADALAASSREVESDLAGLIGAEDVEALRAVLIRLNRLDPVP